jgi:hypothetical protein
MSQHVSQNPKTPEEREHNRTEIAEVEAEIAVRSAEIEAKIGALIETHSARLRGLGLHHPGTMVGGPLSPIWTRPPRPPSSGWRS